MKRFWKILTTIFVLGLVLVGCGKSSSSSSSSQKANDGEDRGRWCG
ncbi:Outer membrane lipoprotein [Lacticaseibacillus paracasei subsp. paracasei Lpp228]|nr:Outer membrane lipoprotein [Lacticaseibacillus paracasei subsp. paracasei Lpp228]